MKRILAVFLTLLIFGMAAGCKPKETPVASPSMSALPSPAASTDAPGAAEAAAYEKALPYLKTLMEAAGYTEYDKSFDPTRRETYDGAECYAIVGSVSGESIYSIGVALEGKNVFAYEQKTDKYAKIDGEGQTEPDYGAFIVQKAPEGEPVDDMNGVEDVTITDGKTIHHASDYVKAIMARYRSDAAARGDDPSQIVLTQVDVTEIDNASSDLGKDNCFQYVVYLLDTKGTEDPADDEYYDVAPYAISADGQRLYSYDLDAGVFQPVS